MKDPLVSVVIPVFNRPLLLAEALESVAGQTYPNVEVIVVDDGSADGPQEVVERFAAAERLPTQYIWQENQGPGPARNNALKYCRGELVQYLDSDDLLLPSKLELQVEAMQRSPMAVMCYGITTNETEDGIQRPRKLIDRFIPDLVESALQFRRYGTPGPLWRYPADIDWRGIPWWSSARRGEDVVHDVRVGVMNPEIVFVPAHLARMRAFTEDRASQWLQSESRKAQHQYVMECAQALDEAGLANRPAYARRLAERAYFEGLMLARTGDTGLSRELLRLAWQLKASPLFRVEARVADMVLRALAELGVPTGQVPRRVFQLHRYLHGEDLHCGRSVPG